MIGKSRLAAKPELGLGLGTGIPAMIPVALEECRNLPEK